MGEALTLDLAWRHGPGAVQGGLVATDTGLSVQEVVEAIRPALEAAGVRVTVREEMTSGDGGVEVNGRDLEEILERVREGHLYCRARSRREEIAAIRHPLAEDEARAAGGYTEFMLRKALLLAIEGED